MFEAAIIYVLEKLGEYSLYIFTTYVLTANIPFVERYCIHHHFCFYL